MNTEAVSREHLRQTATRLSSEVIQEILRAVGSLQYGAIEITVHESRVVQIERREKIRFDKPKPSAIELRKD